MDLREIYRELNGSYEAMLDRLRRDDMIEMFLREFLRDGEFDKLKSAMAEHRDRDAFEAAHGLKGVALNMELGLLVRSIVPLTEALRHGRADNAEELFEQVRADYAQTVAIIKRFLGEK